MAERKVSKFETRMEQFGAWIEKYVAPPCEVRQPKAYGCDQDRVYQNHPVYHRGSVPLILTNLPIRTGKPVCALC